MIKLSFLIMMIVKLSSMIDGYTYIYDYEITKVRDFAFEISPLFVENGFGNSNHQVEFATILQKVPSFALPPVNWRAGTDRCGKQILMNPAWEFATYVWYGSPIWYETVSHEMAHIYQGCGNVGDNIQTEWTADLMGLEVLASIDHPLIRLSLIAALREMAIGSVIRRLYSNNSDPQGFLDRLKLSDNERQYYQDVIDYCQASEILCMQKSAKYFEGPLYRLLKSHDDTIYFAANNSDVIVVDDLMALIREWFGDRCYIKYCID